ncbi:glycosyl transferase [beta proteobacterium AAP121]|nr:glycosyl transferase [beta proteobacterium AAP65]KPF99109.1 glycosyl transferase [beta proteobacterium AAP121]
MSIAPYLKDIGRGAAGARDLGLSAAEALMGAVLDGEASPAECGAFVMAMRMKGETLDELAGFLQAVQARCIAVPSTRPVVLLPSYNGSRRLPNLTPLLAMSLAREGLNVLVHGPLAQPQRVCTAAILADLGLAPAQQVQDIEDAWARREPAFVPTAVLCPPLQALLDLRALIGLRGPGHTVAKMINPVQGAPAMRVVNHTHPEFGALMATWAQRHAIDAQLLRGTEGEPVADPRRLPRIDTWLGGAHRPEHSAAAQDGVLSELPVLPRSTDAACTAVYVQEVLSGSRPAPAPLARQVALLVGAVAALQARGAGRALSA